MSERLRSDSISYQQKQQNRYQKTNSTKMSEGDLGTRKTLFVLVIVVGCFAVLWPKVFYPMLVGPTSERMKPNSFDKGCCDVISDIDVNTIKIMNELCNSIIQQTDTSEKPLKGQEVIIRCRKEILNKCGIDISAVLQEQVRLGRSFKQIVDEVRSFNGSLCLKYKFGVSPWKFGASHRVSFNVTPVYIRQERPAHLRPEMLHPALREKGRAIPQPFHPPGKGSLPRFVDGRPGPVPGIRPPMGAGHVVQPQKSMNSMGVIMPIYTIGIVIFFSYTLMKLVFKRKPESPGGHLYPPVEPSMTFRREVFESQKSRPSREPGSIVNAMTALLDEVDQELEARRRANEIASQKEATPNGTLIANGSAPQDHDQPSVKVLGMEMTASCEGGQKWSRPDSPVMPNTPPPPPEPVDPPQEIYLEGSLPAQSQLLVADSRTQPEPSPAVADPAVVLASKMTLSVISLDSQESDNENETVEKSGLRNGGLIDRETFEDDGIDESKYTTASGATAAERDISDGEKTDDENDIEEIEKLPDYVIDNGAQNIEDPDIDLELNVEDETAVTAAASASAIQDKFDDFKLPAPSALELDDNSKWKEELEQLRKRISLDFEENEEAGAIDVAGAVESEFQENIPPLKFGIEEQEFSRFTDDLGIGDGNSSLKQSTNLITPESIDDIGDVIDDVINIGTRMSEIISAERRASDTEPKEFAVGVEVQNVETAAGSSEIKTDSSLLNQPEIEHEQSDQHLQTKMDDVNG